MIEIQDYDRTKTDLFAENDAELYRGGQRDEKIKRFYKIEKKRNGDILYYLNLERGYVERGKDGFFAVFSVLDNGKKWYQYTLEHIKRV